MKSRAGQVKRCRRLAAAVVVWLLAARASATPRVLIVSIDGLRPDVALRADMPVFRSLMARGCFTFLATTTPAAITLPSHTSMLTGVTIERHGITGNDDEAAADEPLRVPTIFDLAKAAGVPTGMASGKSKFSLYDKPIDHWWQPNSKPAKKKSATGALISYSAGVVVSDDVTADHAVRIVRDFAPRLMFVHFGYNDEIGHAQGWGSAAQVAGLARTDAGLGRVIAAYRDRGLLDETTVIVTSDHGGAGRVHGATVEGSKYIPWVIAGPGVRHDLDLSLFRNWPVQTYDTFATACQVLGLRYADDVDGRPVTPAFEGVELMVAATRPAAVPHGTTTQPASQP